MISFKRVFKFSIIGLALTSFFPSIGLANICCAANNGYAPIVVTSGTCMQWVNNCQPGINRSQVPLTQCTNSQGQLVAIFNQSCNQI